MLLSSWLETWRSWTWPDFGKRSRNLKKSPKSQPNNLTCLRRLDCQLFQPSYGNGWVLFSQIEGCIFASDAKINEMIKDVESLYATHYSKRVLQNIEPSDNQRFCAADGNKKVARDRLRGTIQPNTQHSRSFRSGIYVGLGVPALARAVYLSKH